MWSPEAQVCQLDFLYLRDPESHSFMATAAKAASDFQILNKPCVSESEVQQSTFFVDWSVTGRRKL